jgi:hypothetical protein
VEAPTQLKKLTFIALLLPSICLAGGPKYTYRDTPGLDDEMNNVYHDIKYPVIQYGSVSSETVTFITASSGTISSLYVPVNLGVGSKDPTQFGLHKAIIAKDVAAPGDHGSNSQIAVNGASNVLKKMGIGFDTTNNYGFMQAEIQGSSFNQIVLNPDGGAVSLRGTSTNDSASSGFVGEYIESVIGSGSAVSLVSGTPKTITSISLTAGDWDVFGLGGYLFTSATMTLMLVGSSLTDNTVGAESQMQVSQISQSADCRWTIPTYRISVAATTTVYLVAQGNFTGTGLKAFGRISARRMR